MLFKVLLGLLAGLVLADYGVAWLDRDRDLRAKGSMVADDQLGWVNRPGIKYGVSRINSLGLRGREIPPAAPADEVRILGVGASRVFGSGVPTPETWAESTQEICDARFPGANWRILNGGVKGFSARQAARLAIKMIPEVQPDLVILFISPGSQSILGPGLDSQSMTVGDILVPKDIVEDVPEFLRPLAVKLHHLLLHSNLYARYRAQFLGQEDKQKRVQGFILSRAERGPVIESMLQYTLTDLDLLAAACADSGVNLRLLVLPEPQQQHRVTWAKHLRSMASKGAPSISTPRAEPTTVLIELLKTRGFDVWDFSNELGVIHDDMEKFCVDKSHWSPAGHDLMARGILLRMTRDDRLVGKLIRDRRENPRQ